MILIRGMKAPVYVKLLITIILIFVICLYLYNGNIGFKLILSSLICVLWTIVEFIVGCFFSLIGADYIWQVFTGSIISKTLTLIIVISIQMIFKDEHIRSLPKKYSILIMLITIGSLYVTYNIFILAQSLENSKELLDDSLIGLAIMFFINVAIFKILIKLNQQSDLRRENTAYSQQLNMYNSYVSEKETMLLEFRNAQHDLKHHYIVMMEMLLLNEIEGLKDYLSHLTIENKYDKLGIARTGNIAVDALVNAKYAFAKQHHIPFDVQLNIPISLSFQNADLSILLGNILDNSFEATLQLPVKKQFVELVIKYEKNILIIVLRNTFNGYLLKDKYENILTTKSDAESHGIGLKSVAKIAEKYHGSVIVEDVNGIFMVKILLCDH